MLVTFAAWTIPDCQIPGRFLNQPWRSKLPIHSAAASGSFSLLLDLLAFQAAEGLAF